MLDSEPGVRSVAETLAHLVVSARFPKRMHGERITQTSFDYFNAAMEQIAREEKELTTRAQILKALKQEGDEFASWLESLSDEVLAERVHFPAPVQPSSKTRFEMLLATKEHEMHHRGQLMRVERMLGIVPHLTREYEERGAQMRKQQQAGARG